ncbi:MAG: hypothetical protein KC493_15105 [Bacteriovoracaceae bacterium]|nr:hypothetical protein [Bacteriovoracaceae bacterium]
MKNKIFPFVITSALIVSITGLIMSYKTTEQKRVEANRPVKKFAERKTFKTNQKITPVKKIKKKKDINDSKQVVISGRKYHVLKESKAIIVSKDGRKHYQYGKHKTGLPVLRNDNTGTKAVFTGNFLLKTKDKNLLSKLIAKFGLKVIQKFEHLGTYYLGSSSPQVLLKELSNLENQIGDDRLELELIENPIKLK